MKARHGATQPQILARNFETGQDVLDAINSTQLEDYPWGTHVPGVGWEEVRYHLFKYICSGRIVQPDREETDAELLDRFVLGLPGGVECARRCSEEFGVSLDEVLAFTEDELGPIEGSSMAFISVILSAASEGLTGGKPN